MEEGTKGRLEHSTLCLKARWQTFLDLVLVVFVSIPCYMLRVGFKCNRQQQIEARLAEEKQQLIKEKQELEVKYASTEEVPTAH